MEDYLKKGNELNEDELRVVLSCWLLGLEYLHNRNMIHGVIEW